MLLLFACFLVGSLYMCSAANLTRSVLSNKCNVQYTHSYNDCVSHFAEFVCDMSRSRKLTRHPLHSANHLQFREDDNQVQ